MQALNKQALRILRLFGNTDVKCVRTSVGPEQEYFLVDKELYEQRKDLVFCGRTLFGAKPPKGQELDDHYFGVIKPRVAAYMADLNEELWKLGVLAKTEHNEVAPSQHELAPIYTTTNIATDHNQLTMEIMQKVAAQARTCLPAPRKALRRSQRLAASTTTGPWLPIPESTSSTPGETPYENAQFLLFLCAVIKAVDDYQDLLRALRRDRRQRPPARRERSAARSCLHVPRRRADRSSRRHRERRALQRSGKDRDEARRPCPAEVHHATPPTATAPRPLPSPATSLSSVCSARRNSIACANIMLNAAVAESLQDICGPPRKGRRFRDGALHDMIQQHHPGPQAHHLQRQRLRRCVDQRGDRKARTSEPAHDAGRDARRFSKKRTFRCSRGSQDLHDRQKFAVSLRDT